MKIKFGGYMKRQSEMTRLTEMMYDVINSKTLSLDEKIEKLNSLKDNVLDFAARTAIYKSCVAWSEEMLRNLKWNIIYLEMRKV